MPSRGNGTGRIQLHQRATDDDAQIIGEDLLINEEHTSDIVATEQQQMSDTTRREYRNRLKRLYKWWMDVYPEYFELGTRVLTIEDKNDIVKYHWRNDRDLIYRGLNVRKVKAFLSVKKKKKEKEDGTIILASVSDIKKYDDAIKWGAGRANELLPSQYYREMEIFIQAYKKEHKEAQKEGRTEEQEADPITSTLYNLFCTWALEAGNIFVWVYTLCMWNLMSRSISIDVLSFHQHKPGVSDSIKFKFDETKCDKTGEFVQEKNCYANPFKPEVCMLLGLGCWISLNIERLSKTEKFFIIPGSGNGSASQRYCSQLSELFTQHFEDARHHLRVSHANAHGVRKGSGIHASSGTTCPPSFVAVAARGEWSIGKILDVYFKFAMGGDQYLGRILAMLDPNSTKFAVLPPHWKEPTHPRVMEGIHLNFHGVLQAHEKNDPSGMLSLLFASIVHHSDWLQGICAEHPSHPFHDIPILGAPELLRDLKDNHLTSDPTPQVPTATGIPPHVAHAIAIKSVKDSVDKTQALVTEFREDIRLAVSDAVDAKVSAEGGINMAIMNGSLEALKNDLIAKMDTLTISREDAAAMATLMEVKPVVRVATQFQFSYSGGLWCVPEAFSFPSGATRMAGWRRWLKGGVHYDGNVGWRIKPYRHLVGRDLHTAVLKTQLKNEWRPIFVMMMKAPGMEAPPPKVEDMTEAYIRESFRLGTEYVRLRASYMFEKPEGLVSSYTVGTWSHKVQRSAILKYGNEEDIALLPEATRRNGNHSRTRTYVQPRRRNVRTRRQRNTTRGEANTGAAGAGGPVVDNTVNNLDPSVVW